MEQEDFGESMVYSICERFITKDHPAYLEWRTDCQCDEIVSADCSLFSHKLLWAYDDKIKLSDHEQWLAVLVIKKGEDLPSLEGFEFCGYDLVDGEDEFSTGFGTSSLTNCSFDGIFSLKDLNPYGLCDSRKQAEHLQELLRKRFPDEPRADCIICAVWRKTNIKK